MFALHMLDVGQGEAILMDLPDGSFALVDGGPRRDAAGVIEQVERRAERGDRFRFAAASHWDTDHIAGLPEIIRRVPPVEFLRPGIDTLLLEQLFERMGRGDVSKAIKSLLTVCREADIDEQGLFARQPILEVGEGVEMYALAPDARMNRLVEHTIASSSLDSLSVASLKPLRNQTSLVLWVRVYGRNLLLTGEVTGDEVQAMRQQFHFVRPRPGAIPFDDPRAIWIKLPHHGSEKNACPELFQFFAAPRFVASASHGAQWSHPHPEVLRLVHFNSTSGNIGSAMCTRLGKGCALIRADRNSYRPDEPEKWARSRDWTRDPNPGRTCYGTITVRIAPDGDCTITGTAEGEVDCPYGGPTDGSMTL